MNSAQKSVMAVLLLCLLPAAAGAEGNIHIGQLKINPFVSVAETFSDNIYYTSTEEKTDSLTTTTPGVRLNLPFSNHRADLEYSSVFSRYHTYSGENTTDYNANGAVDFKFGSLFGLKLSDRYAKGHEPRGASSTGFIELFNTNAATASATYQLADLSKIQLDYGKTSWSFKTSDFRNRDEDLFAGSLFYRFLPKTSAFIEYDHKKVSFSQDTLGLDNVADSLLAGLTWEFSARSKGTIKGGMTRKNYTSPFLKTFEGWTGSADAQHAFTDYTALLISGQRSLNESSVPGNRYLITTGGYAELSHRLGRRTAVAVRGSYGEDSYSDAVPPDPARIDRTIVTGAGFKYQFREWCEFAFDYNTKKRRSNIPVNDYNEQSSIVTANISL